MPRTVKEKEYAVKRNEILDMAEQLIYRKGYEQMTIQDILDGLEISKGAFYHYFDSKQALLEALVERMLELAEQAILPIVQDPNLPALEKMQRYFATANRWKSERKAFLIPFIQVWYADDNAIVREKFNTMGSEHVGPWLAQIIRQGVQEETMNTPYPEQMGALVLSILWKLGDTFARLLINYEGGSESPQRAQDMVVAYSDALERVLGAPKGSLQLMDDESVKEWFVAWDEQANRQSVTEPLKTTQNP
ncbi:MAG TPA: TetR/AcrR family transcriptional regulator [Ktedonobacteraceae bacterium]|jgi:AcrR family transcriptional regulator|nr:TetR/AcrR family transcriptional regulator [Ktedonobacteraceae bacterium]